MHHYHYSCPPQAAFMPASGQKPRDFDFDRILNHSIDSISRSETSEEALSSSHEVRSGVGDDRGKNERPLHDR